MHPAPLFRVRFGKENQSDLRIDLVGFKSREVVDRYIIAFPFPAPQNGMMIGDFCAQVYLFINFWKKVHLVIHPYSTVKVNVSGKYFHRLVSRGVIE